MNQTEEIRELLNSALIAGKAMRASVMLEAKNGNPLMTFAERRKLDMDIEKCQQELNKL